MFTLFKARPRTWITGLHSLFRAPPAAECEAGVLDFYHEQLEAIGNSVNVWRLRGERDRDFAFRIAVELCDRLNKLEAALDVVVAYERPQKEARND